MATLSSRSLIRRLLHTFQAALDIYSIRFSIGLIASLLFVIGLTQLPLREVTPRVGWKVKTAGEDIQISDFQVVTKDAARSAQSSTDDAATPATRQGEDATHSPADEPPSTPDEPSPATDTGTGEDDASMRQRPVQLAALGPSGRAPRFIGGRGSFYLRIAYPEEARRQGIEGRVVLEFVVDTDGVTRDIRVTQSLHPLCDSSAVSALKQTRFMPARRNGKRVSVRMRLPVRFQIVKYSMSTADAEQQSPPL